MISFLSFEDESCSWVLDLWQFLNKMFRGVWKERVTIIKPREDKGGHKYFCRVLSFYLFQKQKQRNVRQKLMTNNEIGSLHFLSVTFYHLTRQAKLSKGAARWFPVTWGHDVVGVWWGGGWKWSGFQRADFCAVSRVISLMILNTATSTADSRRLSYTAEHVARPSAIRFIKPFILEPSRPGHTPSCFVWVSTWLRSLFTPRFARCLNRLPVLVSAGL